MDEGGLTLCPDCARKARRKRLSRKVVGWGTVAVLTVGAVVWVGTYQRAFDYGKHGRKIRALALQLEKEPCDRPKMLELGEALYQAGDYRRAIDDAGAFIARCGAYPRMLWLTYEAHKRLSEWAEAVSDATVLIERDPNDKDFWWWRAAAFEESGELENAVSDYRQAIAVEPRLSSIPFNLADVLERLGRPCEAIFPIEQYLHHHPRSREDEAVNSRLARLYGRPTCAQLHGSGRAVIRFPPGARAIMARATVDGQAGNFIVDTGASFVALSRPFAERVGVDLEHAASILVQTAGGIRKARLTAVDRVELGGVRADRVEVAVSDELPEDVDGLLGLSFLSRFALQLDARAGRLEIAARETH